MEMVLAYTSQELTTNSDGVSSSAVCPVIIMNLITIQTKLTTIVTQLEILVTILPRNSQRGPTEFNGDLLGRYKVHRPTVTNEHQTDIDDDSVGDACDVCPTIPNESQGDIDQDKIGDKFGDNLSSFSNRQST